MCKWSKEKGLIITDDWNKYTYNESVFQTDLLSHKELKDFQKKAHRYFYNRPSHILRLFKKMIHNEPISTIPYAITFLKEKVIDK